MENKFATCTIAEIILWTIGQWYKRIISKKLLNLQVNYEELQPLLCEVESKLNNRSITCYYSDSTEECLTPNHIIFGRKLKLFDIELREISTDVSCH